MNFPKIYLQIPHYNNASYLKECFESCQRLTYPNLEIHFFDDASTDNTIDILSKINIDKVHIHRNQSRLGRVKNYQNCFANHGNADWYINLDSDDYYLEKDWIEEAMTIVKSHSEDNIAHIQTNLLDYVSLANISPIKDYENGYFLISGKDYLEICIKYYCFSHLSSIFNIDLVSKFGAYTDNCLHTDFFTAMRAAIQGNVLISDRQIGFWRKHDGNQSDERYTAEEYAKNEISYYHFFEWCEDFIPYTRLKKIVQIFEKREFEKKISLLAEKRNYKEIIGKSIDEKQFNLNSISIFLKFLFNINDSKNKILTDTLGNVGSGIITKGLSVLITILSLPYIIKLLGIENYGWVGFYTALISAIYIFDFGFTNIITKEITQQKTNKLFNKKTILGSLETIYFGIGFLILAILFIGAPWISDHLFMHSTSNLAHKTSIIRLIAFAIFFQWPHSFYTGALFGFNRQVLANNWQLGMTFLKNVGVLFILAYIRCDIYVFFYWQIAISILTLLIQKYYISKELRAWNIIQYFDVKYLQYIKELTIGISLIGIFSFVYTDLNNILLAKWLSLSNYGYYNILLNIVMAMIMFCASVKSALFPNISKLVNQSNKSGIYAQYIYFLKLISFPLIPISILFSMNSYDLIKLWFDDSSMALAISPSVPWMTMGSLANSLMVIPLAFLIAKGNTRYLVLQSGVLAIVSMPILYLLTQNYALKGSSIYWFLINAIPCVLMHIYFDSIYKINVWDKWNTCIFIPFIISIALYSIYPTLNYFLEINSTINSFLLLILTLLTYYILFHQFKTKKAA